MIAGKKYIEEDDYDIEKDGSLWCSGLFNCQAVLLVGRGISMGHFTTYKKSNIDRLTKMIKRLEQDPYDLGYIVVSGYKYEHNLWISELEGRGISKIAEYSDEYEKIQRYSKFVAANKNEALLHLHPLDGLAEERFIRLL